MKITRKLILNVVHHGQATKKIFHSRLLLLLLILLLLLLLLLSLYLMLTLKTKLKIIIKKKL